MFLVLSTFLETPINIPHPTNVTHELNSLRQCSDPPAGRCILLMHLQCFVKPPGGRVNERLGWRETGMVYQTGASMLLSSRLELEVDADIYRHGNIVVPCQISPKLIHADTTD